MFLYELNPERPKSELMIPADALSFKKSILGLLFKKSSSLIIQPRATDGENPIRLSGDNLGEETKAELKLTIYLLFVSQSI